MQQRPTRDAAARCASPKFRRGPRRRRLEAASRVASRQARGGRTRPRSAATSIGRQERWRSHHTQGTARGSCLCLTQTHNPGHSNPGHTRTPDRAPRTPRTLNGHGPRADQRRAHTHGPSELRSLVGIYVFTVFTFRLNMDHIYCIYFSKSPSGPPHCIHCIYFSTEYGPDLLY